MKIESELLTSFSDAMYHFSKDGDRLSDFANSLSRTQYLSKSWLVSKVAKHAAPRSTVMILGGWYGTYLIPMLISNIAPSMIIFNDIDPFCTFMVNRMYGNKLPMQFSNVDVNQSFEELNSKRADVVINTSCEHMNDMIDLKNINDECLYAFQSTNTKDDPGHINTCDSTDELIFKSGLTKVVDSGRLVITGKKTRYMAIGYKSS